MLSSVEFIGVFAVILALLLWSDVSDFISTPTKQRVTAVVEALVVAMILAGVVVAGGHLVGYQAAQATVQAEQEITQQDKEAEDLAASVAVRTKLVNKFSVQTQDKLLAVFKNTYLAKVDRTCALALIISSKYAIKHKTPAYKGCGFTATDFLAIGLVFPHK